MSGAKPWSCESGHGSALRARSGIVHHGALGRASETRVSSGSNVAASMLTIDASDSARRCEAR